MFKFSFLFAVFALLTSGCTVITDSYIPFNSEGPIIEARTSLKEVVEESKQVVADSKKMVNDILKLIEEGKNIPEELMPLLEEAKTNEVVHEIYLKLMADGSIEQFDILK